MSLRIKIGADELILSLRKNNKIPKGTSNQMLGKEILKIIKQLDGEKDTPDSISSYFDDKYVQELDLTMDSTQYKININKIGDLYIKLYERYN